MDVLVVVGGQVRLVGGYSLRRTGQSFATLDAEERPGGTWRRGWDSLRAYSPACYGSLLGCVMPGGPGKYLHGVEVVG